MAACWAQLRSLSNAGVTSSPRVVAWCRRIYIVDESLAGLRTPAFGCPTNMPRLFSKRFRANQLWPASAATQRDFEGKSSIADHKNSDATRRQRGGNYLERICQSAKTPTEQEQENHKRTEAQNDSDWNPGDILGTRNRCLGMIRKLLTDARETS